MLPTATTSPYFWSIEGGRGARSAHAWIRQCIRAPSKSAPVCCMTVSSMPRATSVLEGQSVLLGSMFQLRSPTVPQFIELVSGGRLRAPDRQYERITENIDGRVATMTVHHEQITDQLLCR